MDLPIESVCPGMIVDQDVYFMGEIKLLDQGTVLTEEHIATLQQHCITHVNILNTQFADYCVWPRAQAVKPSLPAEKAPVLSESDLRQVLRNVSVFAGFDDLQISFIVQQSTRARYAPNTVLFNQGDLGDAFLVILKGSVKIFIKSGQDKELVLSVLRVGDSFGELSLIDGQPRSASAKTLEETELMYFARDKFYELLNAHPKLAQGIMVELAKRLRNTNTQISDLFFHDARYRIFKNLIWIANRFGKRKGDVIQVKMPLDYDELSQMAMVDRKELDEVIRQLEKKGLLKMKKSSYEIHLSSMKC